MRPQPVLMLKNVSCSKYIIKDSAYKLDWYKIMTFLYIRKSFQTTSMRE